MFRFIATTFLVSLSLLPSFVRAEQSPHTSPFRIGVILPLSGEYAIIGEGLQGGIQLALDDLSESERARVEVIYEDDQMQSSRTVAAFRKLTTLNKIDALIVPSSGTSHAIAPLAEKAKIPMLAIASDPRLVESRKYVFNFWVTPEEEVRVLLPEAARRGYKRIARVTAIQEGALSVRDAFDSENKDQIEIVLDKEFPPSEKDFRPFLTKLKSYDVDAILLMIFPSQISVFVKEMKELGINKEVFGLEVFEDPALVEASGGALLGAWYAQADTADPSFLSRFKERYPKASPWVAGNGYDALKLLTEATAKMSSHADVSRYISTLKNFSGVLGSYSATGDNRFTMPATLKVVTKSGFEKLSDLGGKG